MERVVGAGGNFSTKLKYYKHSFFFNFRFLCFIEVVIGVCSDLEFFWLLRSDG